MLGGWVKNMFKKLISKETHVLSKHYRIKTYEVVSRFQVSVLLSGSSSVALCGFRPPSMLQVIVNVEPPSSSSSSLYR